MSSTPARRRRPSPAVYRRRRLAVLLVVAVVVAGVVLAIWQPWQGIAAPAPAPSASSASAIPASPSVAATPAASPESTDAAADAAQPSPSPAATASDLEPCSARAVSVAAVTDKDVYGGGELPQLSITLTNNGTEACLMNVGTSTQKFIITSGADTWWQSTDCQSESSDLVVQIDPGQTVSSSSALTWDRTRSSVDSCGGDRPSAPSGYFNLAVEIGGLAAHQTAQFVLN